ncbi:MAG: sulfotransferase [Gammaproteobacteria bacterium]
MTLGSLKSTLAGVRSAMLNGGYGALGKITGNIAVQRPVFVVGTGRCGSTLVAKMLRAHREMAGFPNEANELWHPRSYPHYRASIDTPPILIDPRRFTELSIRHWPAAHEDTIRRTFAAFLLTKGARKTFFLKSAMISFMVPKLLEMFPDARIVHIYRNGPAVVRSLLEKEWDKHIGYVESEEDFRRCCARYWNDCIMELEQRKADITRRGQGTYYEFSYESLCESPREVMGGLAAYLGVDLDGFDLRMVEIKSRNYKVDGYRNDPQWRELLETMAPAMRLKGYVF